MLVAASAVAAFFGAPGAEQALALPTMPPGQVAPESQTRPAAAESGALPDSVFLHARHTALQCQDCHSMQSGHGALRVTGSEGCRSCHHAPEQTASGCRQCHEGAELLNAAYPRRLVASLSVRDAPVERIVAFRHEPHAQALCVECHVQPGPSLRPVVDCASCHEDHHVADGTGCWQCHAEPAADAHPLEVHEGCAGSACHVDSPFDAAPATRTGCLWCHAEQMDHKPQGECADCHLVGGPTPTAASSNPVGAASVAREHPPHANGGFSRLLSDLWVRYLLVVQSAGS